jgi:DNA-binding transcriptional MerR regulator
MATRLSRESSGSDAVEMSLAALADKAGLPGRTVRFYIAKGLLPGPRKAGRNAAYGPDHLKRLQTIRKLQDKGLMLAEISRAMAGEGTNEALPVPTSWWQYPIHEDVVVWVRTDASPWRLRQVRKFLKDVAAGLEKAEERSEL